MRIGRILAVLGVILLGPVTIIIANGCGTSKTTESGGTVGINLRNESIAKAIIRGSTLILERKLRIPAWADKGRSISNMELWTHVDHVAVEIDPTICLVDHPAVEASDCAKFEALGAYEPTQGLKSVRIDHVVIKVSNKKLYDQWTQAIIQARENSILPEVISARP